MKLTIEQEENLVHGHVVSITVGQTRCVLLRADVYEQTQQALEARSAAEAYPAILQAWDAEGGHQRDAAVYADCGRQP